MPRTGRTADRVRAVLQHIHLPPGFKIDLYAIVPDARHMAVGATTGIVFVGTTGTKVWAVAPGAPHNVEAFAPSVAFDLPNGPCFSEDGVLYIAERNRVLAFPHAESSHDTPNPPAETVAASLIPKQDESSGHSARVCRVGPDDKLYIALGQPYNVPPPGKLAEFDQWGIGGIIRMDRTGANREVFARGIRNSVGMDFSPRTGELWFTDNQVDRMGDDTPPGELNRAPRAGLNFGFPWYGGGHVRTNEYRNATPPPGVVFPEVEEFAHAADLGMIFYRGAMFPERYRGAIFSAQHGSWDRTVPVGARVMVTLAQPDGGALHSDPFAEGWLDHDTGGYSGRPVDVAELPDGSLLVSDDFAGALYRISYAAP